MSFLLALFPILLILFLMVGLRWGAARAGGAGYLSALVIAVVFFGAGIQLLAYAQVKALFLSLDVLMIIWAAFLLYRVADEAGAIQTIGQALPHLTNDAGMQAVIIGWVFATFLQGVGGFGVPVAVTAPLLVSLGFTPLVAVVLPSIGHVWAITFGSLGSSFQALIAASGVSGELLVGTCAFFLAIAGLVSGWMVTHAAGGWVAVRRLFVPVALLGALMGGVQYLVVVSGFWNIGSFIAGMVGLVACYPLGRRFHGAAKNNGKLDLRSLLIAISGYLVMVVIILAVQMIPAIKNLLSGVILQVRFPEVRTSLGFVTPASASNRIVLFRHAGMVLFYSCVAAYFIYWQAGLYPPGAPRSILSGTVRRVLASSVSIASMVSMAVIMENSGMTDALARGLAESTRAVFPSVAPWIGSVGAFMTGSTTNSNLVFAALQMHTAEFLGYSVVIILAAQAAGASLASMMAPAKVVVGTSTTGMAGHEGDVLRKLVPYGGLLVLLVSVLAMIGIWLAGGKTP